MEDQLYQNVDLVQFYDYDNLWENEERYVQLAEKVKSVLDLGCGTGRLASALAEKGKDVVGVEYAQAMLERAKKRSSEVKWVQGDARTIRLEQKFDLIILSGHVFQVFLTKEDRLAVLETIKVHLNEGGRYIFDSRNPLVKDWLTWTKEESIRQFKHPLHGQVTAWNTYEGDARALTYTTYYSIDNTQENFSSQSTIAFPSFNEIGLLVADAGLGIAEVFGDWELNRYNEYSEEIIWYGYA
ncbi:class I SAM-dependent methyltransferase [Myroides odoratimimus]|uniref:Methyltransferase domain-containing protein n=1 Tax=Myroides odoratimimus CIP 101113 TaxID=883154 RepID=A0AAV3F3D4_9FLAO|nr:MULTISPECIES: class I SAM-dependent methyltransferase [Myroides]AJA69799.1 Methylase involved in ubiquinone/menaquinone biosynthesis [Myroides sp. A21]APA93074.1 methyltransferase type 11 [Myroides sp. ZB35]EHO12493.1 hypothetical protein HMPREF9715_01648 [Myroides odoratimimus CIP 101113]EKB07016.1 hypothetical protein HMPREF9711_00326 [Myroides odoratimimus CCUG 3837]MCS7474585.1 class I SAM-dependent methyltransferase [Myroides odoratimimus]